MGSPVHRFPRTRGGEKGGRGREQSERARVTPLGRRNINSGAPSTRGCPVPPAPTTPLAGGAKQTGLPSPAQRHIVRPCGSYLGLRARPGGGPSGAGAARGGAERSGEPRPAGTEAGSPRGAAPRLGVPSCSAAAAASSSQAARAGRLRGLGQHFPAVSPLSGGVLWHARTHPRAARSFGKRKKK